MEYELQWFCFFCFCFFKQKTAYEMRISDWSSDVCSSDLRRIFFLCAARRVAMFVAPDGSRRSFVAFNEAPDTRARRIEQDFACAVTEEIGRASCRERVCPYV